MTAKCTLQRQPVVIDLDKQPSIELTPSGGVLYFAVGLCGKPCVLGGNFSHSENVLVLDVTFSLTEVEESVSTSDGRLCPDETAPWHLPPTLRKCVSLSSAHPVYFPTLQHISTLLSMKTVRENGNEALQHPSSMK
jgi:hypothetical protein